MDVSLLIFVVVIVFFTFRGYRQGLLSSLSRVVGLLAGYGAAILYAEPVSKVIEADYQIQGLAAFITAAVLLFIGGGMAVSILFWIVEKLLPKKEERSSVSSLGGALVGMIVGVVLAIAIVWSFAFVRDMRPGASSVAAAGHGAADKYSDYVKPSAVESFSKQVASKAVDTAMSAASTKPQVAKLSSALVRSPVETAQQLQRLTRSPDLQQLLNNPTNQAVLNRGQVEQVQQLPEFKRLAENADMVALARASGMLDPDSLNAAQWEAALAGQVTNIWGRMQRVKNDPRVQAIFNDPEFREGIQSGNPMVLLTNPKLLEFADIVFSDELAPLPAEGGNSSGALASPASSKKETQIYRWVDENGQVHYSDKASQR